MERMYLTEEVADLKDRLLDYVDEIIQRQN
jgi:hypothetical protein